MNMWLTYGIIAVILVIAELVYFKVADKCNIINKPNERSSHSTIVLRGGRGDFYRCDVGLVCVFRGRCFACAQHDRRSASHDGRSYRGVVSSFPDRLDADRGCELLG